VLALATFATMASQARGLQNFISDLRNAKSKVSLEMERKALTGGVHYIINEMPPWMPPWISLVRLDSLALEHVMT